MLIDTHCHLDFPDFDSDRDAVLSRAAAAGVSTIINVGSSLKGSRDAVALSLKYENVFASVGIHPHDAKDCDEGALQEIRRLIKGAKVVAVGEIGLDYYRNLSEPKIQTSVFEDFLKIAQEEKLPVIIHSRQAPEETLSVLRGFGLNNIKAVVVHCFSEDADFLQKCLDLGFFVSFTCNVTYKKAESLRKIVGSVPLDRMFLETDAPFLSPEGMRGKRNESAYLVELAREIARIRAIDLEKVCEETSRNAKKFFNLP